LIERGPGAGRSVFAGIDDRDALVGIIVGILSVNNLGVSRGGVTG
jgi:hypothetical protein